MRQDEELNFSEASLDSRINLVFMPFLGGSEREWSSVVALLQNKFHCAGIDMPGFGSAADVPGYSITQMVEYLAAAVHDLKLGPFVLVGHSMSGKVAAVAALRRQEGDEAFQHLRGLILVASSPPSPEPISDDKRESMMKSLGRAGTRTRAQAEKYIRDNMAPSGSLSPSLFNSAVTDVLRANPDAWDSWLLNGSNEDWSVRVGALDLPALLVAGEQDEALGAALQTDQVLPHFHSGVLEVVPHCAHLVPIERPRELAGLIESFMANFPLQAESEPPTASEDGESAYVRLIRSDRVSEQTRKVLQERSLPKSLQDKPGVLTPVELRILDQVAQQVVPQRGLKVDLAARLDARLSSGKGKGWRYADLPEELHCYQAALATLDLHAKATHGVSFADLGDRLQADLLASVADAALKLNPSDRTPYPLGLEGTSRTLTATQLQRWFEDVCAEITGIYVADPATLARIGYSGIGDGADSAALTGFVRLGLGETEAWEPRAMKVQKP